MHLKKNSLISAVAFCAVLPAVAVASSVSFNLQAHDTDGGQVLEVMWTLTEQNDAVRFEVKVVDNVPGSSVATGDLTGIWFDLAPAGVGFPQLSLSNLSHASVFSAGSVKLGGGVNLEGATNTPFDVGAVVGAEVDKNGKLKDTKGSVTTFTFTAARSSPSDGALTLSDFDNQRFGARVQRISVDGKGDASGKYYGLSGVLELPVGSPPIDPADPIPTPSALAGGIALAGLVLGRRR